MISQAIHHQTQKMTHITASLATETTDEVYLQELANNQAAADCNAEISTQPYSSCLQLDDTEGGTSCIASAKDQKPMYILMTVRHCHSLTSFQHGIAYYRHEP